MSLLIITVKCYKEKNNMNDLIFGELIEALEKAKQPVRLSKEKIAKLQIMDFTDDLEENYPAQAQLIRDVLDTIEE